MVNKVRVLSFKQLLEILQLVYIVISTHIHVQNALLTVKETLKNSKVKCL